MIEYCECCGQPIEDEEFDSGKPLVVSFERYKPL